MLMDVALLTWQLLEGFQPPNNMRNEYQLTLCIYVATVGDLASSQSRHSEQQRQLAMTRHRHRRIQMKTRYSMFVTPQKHTHTFRLSAYFSCRTMRLKWRVAQISRTDISASCCALTRRSSLVAGRDGNWSLLSSSILLFVRTAPARLFARYRCFSRRG